MQDFIVLFIIIIILGLAIGYIVKQKRNGAKCIGCSDSSSCSTDKKNECGCGS